jgi:cyclopropane-fatty-acyl-phospholipid synthase
MSKNHLKARAQEILSSADVRIGGDRPWDIVVHNEDFYSRMLRQGSLGLGESYMDGWWDCQELDQFFHKVFSAGLDRKALVPWSLVGSHLKAWLFNPQDKTRAAAAARRHYDLGNDLFQGMLDKRLVYTSGNWERASNLDEAQEAKLDFVCRKLDLRPGMKVLDIGCGWGSFAKFAAEKYRAEVVGITVSREQCALGQQLCDGLPIEFRLQDYRDVRGAFDRIVSLGMFEHVGYKNYRTFMEVAHRSLRAGGRFYLATIGANRSLRFTDAWIDKYIFPASMLPSIKQIGAAVEGLFVMEEWHNWASYYDKTLMAWFKNFQSSWDRIKSQYSERFYRMWKYYLLGSAASFRARRTQVWQIVLSRTPAPTG